MKSCDTISRHVLSLCHYLHSVFRLRRIFSFPTPLPFVEITPRENNSTLGENYFEKLVGPSPSYWRLNTSRSSIYGSVDIRGTRWIKIVKILYLHIYPSLGDVTLWRRTVVSPSFSDVNRSPQHVLPSTSFSCGGK